MLEINELRAGYGDIEIVHGINLRVKPGEIVALIGPNGAGKSTVLKAVMGIANVMGGSINLEGNELVGMPTHAFAGRGICYIPQGRVIFGELSVEENLLVGILDLGGAERKVRLQRAYAEFPQLEALKARKAYSLSGGEQQMLALDRAVARESRLLLLDEPSLGLSPKLLSHVFSKLADLSRHGTSILLVEQNAKAAVHLAHRTYVIDTGRIVLEGGKRILEKKTLADVYLGKR
ncbi:putative branched-chain amino acid transport ATP-binding protein LivG [Candidatus Burarchaeum australiense]|nr:putative branched-chain amino acid transport ATP-binding protein LivG [Candidatus Burarchaeum australiense]